MCARECVCARTHQPTSCYAVMVHAIDAEGLPLPSSSSSSTANEAGGGSDSRGCYTLTLECFTLVHVDPDEEEGGGSSNSSSSSSSGGGGGGGGGSIALRSSDLPKPLSRRHRVRPVLLTGCTLDSKPSTLGSGSGAANSGRHHPCNFLPGMGV